MVLMMSLRSPKAFKVGSAAVGDGPASWLGFGGEVVAFQLLRPVDQQMPVGADGVALGGVGPQVHDAVLPLLGDQHPVEPGQSFGVHFGRQLAGDIKLGLRPEFQRHQFARPMADAMGDVVAGDVEDTAIVENTPNDHMGMGVAGVVVIDRNPIELRAEVGFHLPHEVTGEAAKVAHLDGILRRDDEAELVAVLPPALDEGTAIRLVLDGGIGAALLAVAHHPVAFEVAQMGVGRLAHRAAHLQAA